LNATPAHTLEAFEELPKRTVCKYPSASVVKQLLFGDSEIRLAQLQDDDSQAMKK
jgi:hypothetical protein